MIKKYCALITVIVVLFSLSVDSLAVTVSWCYTYTVLLLS